MTRLTGWTVAATAVEVGALLAVVHALLHRAMTERGLPRWRVADTLLTSPLLWTGAAVLVGAVNRLVAVAGLRAARDGGAAGGVVVTAGAALAGAAMAWLGVRAVSKLF